MGIFEEAAGAFAAVEAEKKLNPNGGILAEGVAAFAGYEGTEKLEEHFEDKKANDEQEKAAEEQQQGQ